MERVWLVFIQTSQVEKSISLLKLYFCWCNSLRSFHLGWACNHGGSLLREFAQQQIEGCLGFVSSEVTTTFSLSALASSFRDWTEQLGHKKYWKIDMRHWLQKINVYAWAGNSHVTIIKSFRAGGNWHMQLLEKQWYIVHPESPWTNV